MYDAKGNLLYVGKARNLKKRLASYFRESGLSLRIQSMMKQVTRIEVSLTHTETEALLLESNLIKGMKPRFNIPIFGSQSNRISPAYLSIEVRAGTSPATSGLFPVQARSERC